MKIRRDFWQRSYKMPIGFVRGIDAEGDAIIPKHPCESSDDYRQRLSITKPKNIAGSIITQFNSFLYQNEVNRSGIPDDVLNDADLMGNSWNTIMQDAILEAQIKGYHMLLSDTTAPSEPLSMAQAA